MGQLFNPCSLILSDSIGATNEEIQNNEEYVTLLYW